MAVYTGSSIVDYLKSVGQDSSRSARTALARQLGISNYTGTPDQNTQLLNTLRSQQTPAPMAPTAPVPTAIPQPPLPQTVRMSTPYSALQQSPAPAPVPVAYGTQGAPYSPLVTGTGTPGMSPAASVLAQDRITRAPYESEFQSSSTYRLAGGQALPYSQRNVGTYPGSDASTLFDWFNKRGERLPTVQQRSTLYQQLGLGTAASYTGTPKQNRRFLSALQTQAGGGTYARPTGTQQTTDQTRVEPGDAEIRAYIGAHYADPFGGQSDPASFKSGDPIYEWARDALRSGRQITAPGAPGQVIRGVGAQGGQSYAVGGGEAASRLVQAGVDQSLLSALSGQQQQYLDAFLRVQQRNGETGRQMVPPSLSQADLDKFLEDARSEVEPYYQEILSLGKRDFLQQIGELTGEAQAQEAEMARQFPEQLAQQQAAAEAAGLADSGLRMKAEALLAERQKGLVESTRRKVGSELYRTGAGFERQFGTQQLQATGAPQFASRAFETPGVAPAQLAYAPEGVPLRGDIFKQREEETRRRSQEMAARERERQYTAGQYALQGYI